LPPHDSKRFDVHGESGLRIAMHRLVVRRSVYAIAAMATMVDIAERAGVSLSTVSYVLSGKRPVSLDTRERVLQAIEELDYHPNAAARALRGRRSRTLALVMGPHDVQASADTLAGSMRVEIAEFMTTTVRLATERGYHVLLATADEDGSDLRRMAGGSVADGFLLMSVRLEDARAQALKALGVPFGLIGHCARNDGIDFVDFDFERAAEAAVRHLAALGHRRVGFVNHRSQALKVGFGPAVRGQAGFERTVAQLGLQAAAETSEPTVHAGMEAGRRLRRALPGMTAVVSINAEASGGLVRGLREDGVRVPEDMSVVGVVTPFVAELTSPTLTTIDFPAADMARMATTQLIDRLEGLAGKPPVQALLQGEVTVRGSTAEAGGRGESAPARDDTGGDAHVGTQHAQ
jgi:DNA-binding LacI/PurR family transcriptional regulator